MRDFPEQAWGGDITIVVATDYNYLPGVYGLVNSAIETGFKGKFLVATEDARVEKECVYQNILQVLPFKGFGGEYIANVNRLNVFGLLPDGNYLFLDADIFFERPSGILFGALKEGIVVSTEQDKKYDYFDVLFYRQARALGIETKFKPLEYVNCGLVAFQFPRDKEILFKWRDLCRDHLKGVKEVGKDPCWFFPEQDIWNVILKTTDHPIFSISPRLLEINSSPPHFADRPFPYTRQTNLFPVDQHKYIVHGASLPRPWLSRKENLLKHIIVTSGIKSIIRKPTVYERGWAYYACRETLAIPVSSWAEKHSFNLHHSYLWRKTHGI